MNVNELKIKFKELKANLINDKTHKILEDNNFDLARLNEVIENYLENIEQIKDDDLLNTIYSKTQDLMSYTNQSSLYEYIHQFVNAANFLISNVPSELTNIDNDLDTLNEIEIAEEEFSHRYDKLIKLLNFEDEESNIILETLDDKIPFKLYKNKSNSIVVETKNGTKNSRTKNKLVGIIYRNENYQEGSYDKVIIKKLLNNSIFDFFQKKESMELLEAIKDKLSNNENDLLILKSELKYIQEEKKEFEAKTREFDKIFAESKTAKQEYINAKNAAVDDAKLKNSVFYWKEKERAHKFRFRYFGIIAIVLICLLIYMLALFLNNHENGINESEKTQIISTIDKELGNEKKDISSETKVIADKQDGNNFLKDFDYTKLAWYILMVFASSSAFWIIRIIVKIALSNLHLSEDANERVVMIQTYLSFVKEGELKDENDKNLVLSPLFRPSNIGIIQDESSVTVADIMTAFKK